MVFFFTEMQKKKKEQVRMERRTGSSIVDILSLRCQFVIQLELLRSSQIVEFILIQAGDTNFGVFSF